MTNRTALLAALFACAPGAAWFAPAFQKPVQAGPKEPPRAECLELLVRDGDKIARWEVRVESDGKSIKERWDGALHALFPFLDADGNGSLDKKEAGRLPSSFAVRQILWGGFVYGPGTAPPFGTLDSDGDGKITKAEVVDFYHRAGLGSVLVGIGKPPNTDALTEAILTALDTDKNGKVDEKEWLAAPEQLAKLDVNDDELITPGELVPRVVYPGATGANLLLAPSKNITPSPLVASVPLAVLPLSKTDAEWAEPLAKQWKVTAAELLKVRDQPAERRITIRLGQEPVLETDKQNGERLDLTFGSLRFSVRADAGNLSRQWAAARKRYVGEFAEADPKKTGSVTADDVKNQNLAEIRAAVHAADRNGDGKLDEHELEAWLKVQDEFARAHTLLTVLDHGPGLFELLDTNHDGALSVRELRGAWKRLQGAGCVTDGQFDRKKLPRQLCLTSSTGLPTSPLGRPKSVGPTWFQAMDRNGDGDVSRKEFTGPPEAFDKLDLDKDGLLSPDEASKVEVKK